MILACIFSLPLSILSPNLKTSLNFSSPKRCHPAIFPSPNANLRGFLTFSFHCGSHETSLSVLQPIFHHSIFPYSLAVMLLFLFLYRKRFTEHNWSSNLVACLPDLFYSIIEIPSFFLKFSFEICCIIMAFLSKSGIGKLWPTGQIWPALFLGKPFLGHSHVVSVADFTLQWQTVVVVSHILGFPILVCPKCI